MTIIPWDNYFLSASFSKVTYYTFTVTYWNRTDALEISDYTEHTQVAVHWLTSNGDGGGDDYGKFLN